MSNEYICICGHFGFGKTLLNGQTIKTKIVAEEIERVYGEDHVIKIDTSGRIKALPKIFWEIGKASSHCKNIITLLSDNGINIILPMFILCKFFYGIKISHLAIGAELALYLKRNLWAGKLMHKVDMIYAETSVLKKTLQDSGYKNVNILPNCKKLNPIDLNNLQINWQAPYKLCMFARVMKEKGVEDAVNIIKEINEQYGQDTYLLDIYGQVDSHQINWFNNLKQQFTQAIKYKGCIPYNESVETLKNYFALLFPTKFFVEGIPGTIIDAYASGLPVISSKWESFADVIDDRITGYGYEFNNLLELKNLLIKIAANPTMITDLKENCLKKAKEYSTDKIIECLNL